MPTARQELAAVACGKTIFALGGSTGTHAGYLASVQAYSVASGAWTARAPMPTPRDGLAAVKGSDGRIYAIGGDNSGWGAALSTVEAYNVKCNTWVSVASLPASLTGAAAVKGADGADLRVRRLEQPLRWSPGGGGGLRPGLRHLELAARHAHAAPGVRGGRGRAQISVVGGTSDQITPLDTVDALG
jgi:hypothetical protein